MGSGGPLEYAAQTFFAKKEGIQLKPNYRLPIGSVTKKFHRFDLGSDHPAVLVECKSHGWTSGGNSPSAKFSIWNEAMYYFHLAPWYYRKIMFVRRHLRNSWEETLAQRYLRLHRHMVPEGVEFWEFDELTRAGSRLYPDA